MGKIKINFKKNNPDDVIGFNVEMTCRFVLVFNPSSQMSSKYTGVSKIRTCLLVSELEYRVARLLRSRDDDNGGVVVMER